MKRLSLIIPCYNESANIKLLLERCAKLATISDIEVILVNNGSTDDTAAVLSANITRYPHCRAITVSKNQGYGFGILAGLNASEGQILAWTHADLQTDPLDCLKGLELFNKYGDDIFVKGRRYGRSIADLFFTLGMAAFETILLRKLFWDINAQPTMFSRKFFTNWNSPPHDFSLDLYAYYMARNMNLQVHRFPVFFAKREHGKSSWNTNWRARQKFILRTFDYSFDLHSKLHL